MSRKRSIAVIESESHLLELERTSTAVVQARQIAALRLLKNNPTESLRAIASRIGCSERTLNRWIADYQTKGIAGILAPDSNPERITPGLEALIADRVRIGQFDTASHLRRWLKKEHGISCSPSTITALLKRLSIGRQLTLGEPQSAPAGRNLSPAPYIPQWLAEFTATLPPVCDARTWIEHFQASLGQYLPEIDRISININVHCLQTMNAVAPPDLLVRQHMGQKGASSLPINVDTPVAGSSRTPALLEQMEAQGFPLHLYHTPYTEDYFLESDQYAGTIMLWTLATEPPVAQSTVQRLHDIRSLILFMLTDCAARHQTAQPINRQFYPALAHLASTARLTNQEQKVLAMQMLGNTYKEIADLLNVKLDTVGKHISAIHRKSGTRSYSELYARYFTPRLK